MNHKDPCAGVEACANPLCRRAYQQGTGEFFLIEQECSEQYSDPDQRFLAVWLCADCREQYAVLYNPDDNEVSLIDLEQQSAA
jgi:hypothetical protein